jgi:zinc protease
MLMFSSFSLRAVTRDRSISVVTLLCALLMPMPGFSQPSPVALPSDVQYVTSVEGINEYRLSNGLRVLLLADPTKPNITVNITYMVGSRQEDYGETGMAHLLEHLMFRGSTHHPNVPKELKDHGTRPNGITSLDRTKYFETFQASEENLQWALDLEADRMVNAFIAKPDLDTEMTVVRNEYEAGENNPAHVLMQRVFATAYLWHNYGHAVIGARSDIERVPIERLQAFYRHFYQPDNAMLVVAGQIDEAKTLALVHQYFAVIPRPTRILRQTYTVEPTQDGERSVTLRRVGGVQALCVVYHVPAASHEEYPAVEMAAHLLGDVPSGRLGKALGAFGRATGVSASVRNAMEPGVVMATVTVRQGNSLDEAETVLLATIEKLKMNPFTDEEVNRARTQWLKNFELTQNDSEAVALNLTEWQAMGDWRLALLQRDRIRRVTREQIQQAAEKYFVPSNRTLGRFIPDQNPVRAEIPEPPDVAALLQGYRGDAVVARGEEFEATPANIDRRTQRSDLPGGLQLSLLSKKTRGQQVIAILRFNFGDEKSLQGRSTVGSVTRQMLMNGTVYHTRQQLRDEFDRLKAQVTVSGDVSDVVVSIQTTRENFAAVLDLVAEILQEPAFRLSEFNQLKQQQLAALEVQKGDPQAMTTLARQRHLKPYPKGDPRYLATVEERIAEIGALTLDQVKAFHRDFYGASHGQVTVIGDFEAGAVQKQLGELFDDWKSHKSYARVASPYQSIAARAEAFETPDKANANWAAALAFPMTDTDPDYPALTLSSYIIGGGMNSRLFARIRNREGLSYSVSGQISVATGDDSSSFMATAICAPQNAPKVEATFKDEIGRILANDFTADEVTAAKKSWLEAQQVSRAQDRELATRLTSQRFWGRTMAFDAELEQKVAALTPEQMQAALRRSIDPGQFSFFRAGDFKKANVTW